MLLENFEKRLKEAEVALQQSMVKTHQLEGYRESIIHSMEMLKNHHKEENKVDEAS